MMGEQAKPDWIVCAQGDAPMNAEQVIGLDEKHVAYRVRKEPVREVREGTCWVKTWGSISPSFDHSQTTEEFVQGKYTQETLDGKPVKITWSADQ